MREIISIDKDFALGETKLTKKNKPISNIKGKVTVSMFDEKGNPIREINTENLIKDWFKEDAYQRTYVNLLGKGGSSTTGFISEPTKYLLLTDSEEEENVNGNILRGQVIGYAERKKTYSGSSELQGTFNSVESSTYIDEEGNTVVHEVYDFPTNAGNGTIKSVMWSSSINDGNKLGVESIPFTQPSGSGALLRTNLVCEGSYDKKEIYSIDNYMRLCRINNNGKEYIGSKLKSVSGTELSTTNSHTMNGTVEIFKDKVRGIFFNSESSTNSIGVPSGKIGIIEWDGITGDIIGSPLFLDIQNIEEDGITYYMQKITRSEQNIYGLYKNSEKYIVAKFDLEGQLISKSKVLTGGSTIYPSEFGFGYHKGILHLSLCTRSYKLSEDFKVLTSYKGYDVLSESYAYNFLNDDNTNSKWLFLDIGKDSVIFYVSSSPVTTHIKLAKPVIKTNTNTMKVQYDFVIKPASVFNYL